MPSSFLDPSPSDSVLWDHAPPGPAVYRREWCRLEENGAEEYRDPMAPRPGTHRMQVESVAPAEKEVWIVVRGLGGRRVRCPLPIDGIGGDLGRGDTVEVRVHPPTRAHYVTPSGLHLIADGEGGWCVFGGVQEARLASGSGRAELVHLLARAAQ